MCPRQGKEVSDSMLGSGTQPVRRTKKEAPTRSSEVLRSPVYYKTKAHTLSDSHHLRPPSHVQRVSTRKAAKVNETHHFILVGNQLWDMFFFLFHHQSLIQVADNEWRVIPILQGLINVSLDFAEYFDPFIAHKTLLDFFVKWFFHWYFFALHEEILVNFTN